MQSTIYPVNSVPIALEAGLVLVITASSTASGVASVPGESVYRYISASQVYTFGPYSTKREVVIQLNAGSAQADVKDAASDVSYAAAKFRSAIERARSGGVPLLIAMPGDSNTTGTGAGTGTVNMEGAQKWSVGAQLARILDRTFMYTTNDCFFGDQNATQGGITVQQFDPRFSAFGAGWSQDAAPATFGGRMFVGASGGAGALTFAPARPWNRVRLLLGTFSSGATSITVKAGGSSIGTVSNRGATALGDTTVSTGASAAIQSFSLDTVTGGAAYVAGAIFWDSENPGCVVCPGGWYGGLISNANDGTWPWSCKPVAVALGAGLHITNLTINNADAGTAIATYTAAALEFHQAIAAVSDVLVTGMTPSFAGSGVAGRLDAYEAALQSVATAIGSPFTVIDWRDQFGATYAIANAAGWMADGAHLKGIGYARQAAVYANLIRSIAQQ